MCEISVVIATYNRPHLLRKALKSVLVQTYNDFEVIVVDDSDNNDAMKVCDDLKDERIKYYKNERTKGACGARNTGIMKANGRYYTGLDDDDEFSSTRLSELIRMYKKEYSFIASNMKVLCNGKENKVFLRDKIIEYEDILWNNCVGTQIFTELYKVKKVGGFAEDFESSQDLELWTRMLKYWGKAYRCKKVLYKMRIDHGEIRITTSEKRFKGSYRYFKKYRGEMSCDQIKFSELRLKWLKGKIKIDDLLVFIRYPRVMLFIGKKKMKLI